MLKSSWKLPYIDKIFYFFLKKNKFPNIFYIKCRGSNIPRYLLNKIIFVHTGNKFLKLLITKKMLGTKIGSYIFTKKKGRFIHVNQKKKIKKKK